MKNATMTQEERSMLRSVANWTRGVPPVLTDAEVRACESLEARGFLCPVGAGLYGWPWRMTDAGRGA